MTNRIARSLKFEDTKMVVRSHKQKTDRQHNGQMKNDKRTQRSTKHYSENKRSNKANHTKTG